MADFNERKIQTADFAGNDISSVDGTTIVGQADWLKHRFDAVAENVIAPKVNGLIDDLQNEQAATQIGTPALLIGGVQTVAEQLAYLFETITNVSSGSVPDGSITDAKLSNAAGQLKAVVAAMQAAKADLESPNFTGIPTAPTADEGNNSTQIANTAFCENLVAPMNSHILNGNVHVTSELKGKWEGHVADEDIHVTDALKSKWDGHVADESIHVSEKEKVAWDDVANKVGSTVYSITDDSGSGTSWVQGGVKNVPNINKYCLYLVDIAGSETRIICSRKGTRIRGANTFTTSGGVMYVETVNATISGTDVTFVKHSLKKISAGNEISDADAGTPAITAIYGIL